MSYSIALKASMVKRMTGRGALTAAALAEESGISQTTLSRWKRDASRVLDMSAADTPKPKRVQDWTPGEKLRAVAETSGLDDAELGAYLRRHGLHSEQLQAWREAAMGALATPTGKGKRTPDQKRIRRLERDLRRKDKALAETTALLVLKKKFDVLFEDEGDDTAEPNEG